MLKNSVVQVLPKRKPASVFTQGVVCTVITESHEIFSSRGTELSLCNSGPALFLSDTPLGRPMEKLFKDRRKAGPFKDIQSPAEILNKPPVS